MISLHIEWFFLLVFFCQFMFFFLFTSHFCFSLDLQSNWIDAPDAGIVIKSISKKQNTICCYADTLPNMKRTCAPWNYINLDKMSVLSVRTHTYTYSSTQANRTIPINFFFAPSPTLCSKAWVWWAYVG